MPARTLSRPRRSLSLAVALALVSLGLVRCTSGSDGGSAAAVDRVRLIRPGVLTVCTHVPYPPLEYVRGGRVVGFDADLVALVVKRLRVRLSYRDTPFASITSGQALDTGQCDLALAGLTINAARRAVVDFSAPYFIADQAMVVNVGARYDSLASLAGRRLGVQSGTTGQEYVARTAPKSVDAVPYDNFDAEIAAVSDGTIAAAVNDSPVCLDLIAKDKRFRIGATFRTGERYGLAVKKGGNPRLLAIIDDVLAKAKQDGTWTRLYEKWMHAEPTRIP